MKYKGYYILLHTEKHIVQSSGGWRIVFYIQTTFAREKKTWNTDGVRVDKDLFKVGAILDTFLCTSSFYFIINKLKNLTIGQHLAVKEKNRLLFVKNDIYRIDIYRIYFMIIVE